MRAIEDARTPVHLAPARGALSPGFKPKHSSYPNCALGGRPNTAGRKRQGWVMSKNGGLLLRVLAVDDERDVADSTAALLRCFGVDVRAVYDGLTALAVISEFKPHLAFIDLCMPGTDGFETARRIRNLPEGGSLVLAALTAWGHAEARQRAREAGFHYHLVKPLPVEDFEELLAVAHRAL